MVKKTVLIGLDGVPYRLISDLASNGTLAHTRNIINCGTFRKMESSIPEVSNVAWSSIITGKNPGEHGIFGFTDIPIGTYRLSFPNFNNLKALPFWEREAEKRSAIINGPSTFPVRKMNGIHIAGFVALDLERAVYPSSMISQLKEFDYRVDVDASKADKSVDLFLKDLNITLQARIDIYRHIWTQEDWDFFMFVFTGTDRISHFLWDAYEDRNHEYHSDFLRFFSKLDEVIGEIASRLTEDDLLVLISDHGFELLEKEVNVNFLLNEAGFLFLEEDSKKSYKGIERKTKAFALDPGRIYINLKQKYPKGSVTPDDYKKILCEIEERFKTLELNGKKVIRKIYRKEDTYKGPYVYSAPDLVLMPERGFNLKAGLKATKLFENSRFTGKHSQDDAFLLINKKIEEGCLPENLKIQDILDIIYKLQDEKGRQKNA